MSLKRQEDRKDHFLFLYNSIKLWILGKNQLPQQKAEIITLKSSYLFGSREGKNIVNMERFNSRKGIETWRTPEQADCGVRDRERRLTIKQRLTDSSQLKPRLKGRSSSASSSNLLFMGFVSCELGWTGLGEKESFIRRSSLYIGLLWAHQVSDNYVTTIIIPGIDHHHHHPTPPRQIWTTSTIREQLRLQVLDINWLSVL